MNAVEPPVKANSPQRLFFRGGQALPPGFKRPSSLYYYEFVLLRATHVHYTLSPRLWLFLCIFFFQELIN